MTFTLPLPCAHGGPAGRAQLRASPEDFVVREWLGFEPEGEGEHLMLRVRKRGANTLWVAKQLARIAKVHPNDIGFAGLKDRDAVAEQAFTTPLRSARGEDWTGVGGEGFEVLSCVRCRRKLKRGALRGNEFDLLLREFVGARETLEHRLETLARAGVPNYFGPQRFGRDGQNLELAREWFAGEAHPERMERSFALSAARAHIFNAVLAARVAAAEWDRLQPGDVANLNNSGSIFDVHALDETLIGRCERLDVHPTGPMWGAGPLRTRGRVAALEEELAAADPLLCEGLIGAGLEQERRALRTAVENLQWSIEGSDVRLSFRLTRGAFATAVLHEVIDNAFSSEAPEAGE